MGKLRVLSGRDICRILEQHGFQKVKLADNTEGLIIASDTFKVMSR